MSFASLERFDKALETVAERVRRATAALEGHQVPYEVVGGLAVAAWVSRVDPEAVRATRDVDLVIRRQDLPRAQAALEETGFRFRHVAGLSMFVDQVKPSARTGVHLVFENEKVRPEDAHPIPPIAEDPPRAPDGYRIAPLEALVRMKLISFRRKDQVHLDDLLEMKLITPEIEKALPPDLRERLQQLKQTPQG